MISGCGQYIMMSSCSAQTQLREVSDKLVTREQEIKVSGCG